MMYLIAFLIPIILLVGVYLYNWQCRLPIKQMLISFSFGVLAALFCFCWFIFNEDYSPKPDTIIQAITSVMLNSAIPEECIKWMVLSVLLIIGYKRNLYNTHYSVIMCAVCISMGLAALENVLYLLKNEHMIGTIIGRAIMSVPGHCCDAIWMGYFCSIAKFEHSKYWWAIPMSLIIPIMFHFVYNLSIKLISVIDYGWLDNALLLWLPIYTICLCILSFSILKKTKNQAFFSPN